MNNHRDIFRRLIKLVEAPLLSTDARDRRMNLVALVVAVVAALVVGVALEVYLQD